MKKRVFMLLILALVASLLFGCAGQGANESLETSIASQAETEAVTETVEETNMYPMTLVDGAGREVVIASEPTKIISVAPSVTETLFAIGAGDLLVGRTDWCLYPEAASSVESIGTLMEPNIEAIVSKEPDLVIAATHFPEDMLTKLTELEIPVFMLTAQESFEGVYQTTLMAGEITNHNDEAQGLVEAMKAQVADVVSKVEGLDKPSVYYVVGFGDNDYTATGDTFMNDMLEMAGGNNVAKDGEYWSYSIEKLVEHDPSLILVSDKYDSFTGFTSHDKYKDLTAVKEGKVIEIDSDLLSIQGPRLADGLKAIAERLHPEAFK